MTNALMLTLSLLTQTPETPECASVRFALGQIESGSQDKAVGKAGEVSRFQILPGMWNGIIYRHGLGSVNSQSEAEAWVVVKTWLAWNMRPLTKYRPSQIYALWHRPDKFRRARYRLSSLTRREQDRCRRFANLYEMKLRELKGGKFSTLKPK